MSQVVETISINYTFEIIIENTGSINYLKVIFSFDDIIYL